MRWLIRMARASRSIAGKPTGATGWRPVEPSYAIVKIRNWVAFATGRTCLWLTLCISTNP